nr:proline-rich protein 36-like [Aegilops tauschii subsp. strangulata]
MPPTRSPPTPVPAPPAAVVAPPCADHGFASWFMPLPPPPVGRPGAVALLRRSFPLLRSSSLPRPDPVSTSYDQDGVLASVEFVPDSQPPVALVRAAVGSAQAPPPAHAARLEVPVGGGINCSGAEQLAASIPPTSGAPSMQAIRFDAGREAEVTGGWQLVASRKGPRSPALAAPAFKPAPIPRWLLGRCCRCLHRGHRAEACRDPLRYSRCLQNGHKSRGCKNQWKPLSLLDSPGVPPPPLPRPAAVAVQVAAPRSGRGWENPLLPTATSPAPRCSASVMRRSVRRRTTSSSLQRLRCRLSLLSSPPTGQLPG